MQLTDYQRSVLAHVVIDPDAWANHAIETVGEQAVIEKVERYASEYEADKATLGAAYETRAEREVQ